MSDNKVDFSFGWLALKLLGKSLYSNSWSAISELVANGFDAKATDVYVYINIKDKSNSVIEIFDNGTGMSKDEIATYVKVGYNKREDIKKKSPDYADKIMGRKGIGKLAALYLSDDYYLLTKTETDSSNWRMVYNENATNEEQKPFLEEVVDNVQINCTELWNSFTNGTLIRLNHVNLNGFGDGAFSSLEHKLSNYFSLDSMTDRKIMLCVQNTDGEIVFRKVEKTIAFKNMAYIEYSLSNARSLMDKIAEAKDKVINIPYSKYPFLMDMSIKLN